MAAAICRVCVLHAESTFRIEGLDCREEVDLLERRFKHLRGLEAFSADVMSQRLHVQYDASKVSASTIIAAVADAGMRAWLEHDEPVSVGARGERTRWLQIGASGAALCLGLLTSFTGAPVLAGRVLFAISLALSVPLTAPKAIRALRARALDINVLMLVAATGAVCLGEWSEAGAVVVLFAVAQALEARTLARARTAVRVLMGLTPVDALVREGSRERRVPVDSLHPGAVIIIKPGEKVPLDGIVAHGDSDVNQAPVTGESLPVDKVPGDEVFAGSINGRGAIEVTVTRVRRDTTLARIIHLVEQAQAARAPSQALVDRFARVYTPSVIVLAASLAVVPPLFFAAPWPVWIYRALVLLVVSCPCALVISTPVSVVAALAGAARKGVLVKGGSHLERAATVRCVAFDKTGTLTRGTPEVVDVVTLNGESAATVVGLAAAIEQRSAYPIARAILARAQRDGIPVAPGGHVRALSGRGAEGQVGATQVALGNHRLFEERGLCSDDIHRSLDAMGALGRTPVLVARDGVPVGVLGLADRAREVGREAVDALRRMGVRQVVMLTGDSSGAARAVAAEVGVDEFQADQTPEGKVAAVADLRRRFGSVAMVGDGVNDAPALALADIGIAMGAAGSAAALETADVALMADELLKVPYVLRLSQTTLGNIKANLGISLALKAAFVAAAIFGVATLWMAILADTGASVLVVANALRLLHAD